MATITSANAKLSLAVTGIFPVPVVIQGWAADDAFATESVNMAETVKGVDGLFHAGFVFDTYKLTLTIMADSPSIKMMDLLATTLKTQREQSVVSGSIVVPSVGTSYVLTQGYLKSVMPIADAKKVLQAQKYVFEFSDIQPVPIA